MSNTEVPIPSAVPFWASLGLVPLTWIAATQSGWTLILPPMFAWGLFSVLDAALGQNTKNADPDAPEARLFWHKAILRVWFPIQFGTLVGLLLFVQQSASTSVAEAVALFAGFGVLSGSIGIVYAHELMHQPRRSDRWLADLLMASVLYSHFRSEHLLVHHVHVGTPRDHVTARYNEGFHRFILRVLPNCLQSAWRAERDKLNKVGLPVWDRRNPFWRYGILQCGFLALAYLLAGWLGVGLFLVQALCAIIQLELVNYVEHYGLQRRMIGENRYEAVQPHHSWNASPRASSWLLVNLQRHSDHHSNPARSYPLLQNQPDGSAPQLPFGYPTMTFLAAIPPVWRRVMNPRVRAWRRSYYPDISDWPKQARAR